MVIYRAFAFILVDKTCNAWMSAGSLLYGMVMLLHVRSWAIEPFREWAADTGKEYNDLAQSMKVLASDVDETEKKQQTHWHARALEKAHRNRDENHSFDLSLVVIFLHVILLSFLLFFWAADNCDRGTSTNLFVPRAGRATTTRYWDCSGGSCGCGYAQNGTYPSHCYSNALFEAPFGNEFGARFYGAAAVSNVLGGGEWMSEGCGVCWKLTGTSNIAGTPNTTTTIVLKSTNYCTPGNPYCDGKPHFDIAAPGFDFTASSLSNTCEQAEPDEIAGFGACQFWMIDNSTCDCSLFNSSVLRAGCENFLELQWNNPMVDYEEVPCPEDLTRLPCWEANGEVWPEEIPALCEDPYARWDGNLFSPTSAPLSL